jgi:glycosyltransferase involved in cell wall biosynthesis
MRICLVSKQVEPFVSGGIGTYVSILAASLARAGHDVHILTDAHEQLADSAGPGPAGVRFHAVNIRAGAAAMDAYPVGSLRYSMAVSETLISLHRQFHFEYVEFPDYLAEGYFTIRRKRTTGVLADAVLAVRLHTPSVLMREYDRLHAISVEDAYVDHMESAAVAEADLVLSPSRALLGRCALIGAPGIPGNPHQRREVLPLPFDAERSLSQLGALSPATDPGEATVLYIGRLQHLKGPQLLVEAGQSLLESGLKVNFRFVGGDTPSGPFGRSMTDWCRSRVGPQWRDRFAFEGPRPRATLGRLITGATVCVLPSLWENFSMSAVEAMALGACVVASDAGGFPELIRDGTDGLLFRSGSAAALEAALRRSLSDPSLRQATGSSARARVAQLCNPRPIIACIESLVGEHRPPTASPVAAAAPAPEVSVIIPYYNMGRYLPETLASLRMQTFTDFEVIVINDGSTDGPSLRLLESLHDPHVRIIHKPNGGLGSARNRGLREARGRFVLPLDSDDTLHPTFLEATVRVMRMNPGLAVVSTLGLNYTDDPSRPIGGWCPLGLDRDLLTVLNIGAASGSLLDREAALAVGGYDEWLTSYEDWDFWCRLAERGYLGTVIPEFLFQYRVRPDSMFRTEALARHAELRAYLIRAHPNLALSTEHALRMEAGGVGDWSLGGTVERRAQELCRSNLRYRLADRVNDALKIMKLQRAIKTVAGGLTRRPRP